MFQKKFVAGQLLSLLDFSAAQVGNDERVEATTTCIFEMCLLLLDIHVAQRVHAYIHKLDGYIL